MDKIYKISKKTVTITVFVLMLAVMFFLAFYSLFQTTGMNTDNSALENVTFLFDNPIVNIIILFCIVIIISLCTNLIKKIPLKTFIIFTGVFTALLAVIWILSAQSSPTNDSYIVTNAAYEMSQGNYFSLTDSKYFINYPFQLGYVFYTEVLIRLFHIGDNFLFLEVINGILLSASYIALILTCKEISKSETAAKICALLLCFTIQPILFSTFLYGTIPGFAFMIYSVYFYMLYRRNAKKRYAVLSAILLPVAIIIKLNYMIALVAICVIMLCDILKKRKLFDIICLVLLVSLTLGSKAGVVKFYEARANVSLGDGIPIVCWAAMGLSDADIAPGWYSPLYTTYNYEQNAYDREKTSTMAIDSIKDRLKYFAGDRATANEFFTKKILSQFNEPTYQSLWTNQVRNHYKGMGRLASYMCTDGEYATFVYCNISQLLIYVMTFISVILFIKKRSMNMTFLLLIILGGFMYHTIFEGKSQYIIPYFMLMIPVAAVSLHWICDKLSEKVKLKKEASVTHSVND